VVQQPAAGGWKLQPAALEAALECQAGPHLLILTNPGNPSGCSYTRQELQALVPVFRLLSTLSLFRFQVSQFYLQKNAALYENVIP
jgi:histidinol-phosphate/aromatic aminotransferase/cobyric acid decarboxylase-like protein